MPEPEIKTFNENRADLLAKNPNGGFVVIKDTEILGIWQTRVDALKAGFDKYGNISFLVKDIRDNNKIANFSRNLKFA